MNKMEKRVCSTCGLPRSKSSFACHYESHTEICHACKDFCIHRVKLAQSKSLTVHQLFAKEADPARLRRYQALTKAGVVWEQVARRQHSTRKRATKRRRRSSCPTSSSAAASPTNKAPSAKRRRYTCRRSRTVTTVPAPLTAPLTAFVGAPAPAPAHGATGATQPAVCTNTAMDAGALELVDDTASVASVASIASDTAASASSHSPVPDVTVAPPMVVPDTWQVFGDFDAAVDALVRGQDMNASANVDEFAQVVAQLDACAPPLFDADLALDEGLLSLDMSLIDSMSAVDWDRLPVPSPACTPTTPKAFNNASALTVCM